MSHLRPHEPQPLPADPPIGPSAFAIDVARIKVLIDAAVGVASPPPAYFAAIDRRIVAIADRASAVAGIRQQTLSAMLSGAIVMRDCGHVLEHCDAAVGGDLHPDLLPPAIDDLIDRLLRSLAMSHVVASTDG